MTVNDELERMCDEAVTFNVLSQHILRLRIVLVRIVGLWTATRSRDLTKYEAGEPATLLRRSVNKSDISGIHN
jgi:hypothetical protein